MLAKKRGLEPLAEKILLGQQHPFDVYQVAQEYIGEEVADSSAAIEGAQDILAERISDRADLRGTLRNYIKRTGSIQSEQASEENPVYEQYYEFTQAISKIVPHRILALNRGEKEGCLKVSVHVDDVRAK